MKKCNMCNRVVNDDAAFCTNCGSNSFTPVNNAPQQGAPQQGFGNAPQQGAPQQGFGNAPQQGAPQQGFGNAPQQGVPQQNFGNAPQNGFGVPTPPPVVNNTPAKKSKKGLIIGLSIGGGVLLIIIILIIIGATAEKKYQSEDYGASYQSTTEAQDNTDSQEDLSYTKGILSGNTYTNDWLNCTVQFDENWQKASEKKYASYEDSYTECLLYLVSNNNESMVITATNAAGTKYTSLTCEDFIKYQTDALGQKFNITDKSEVSSFFYGGNEYKSQVMCVNLSGIDIYYEICCAKIGERFVDIIAISGSAQECDDVISMCQ